jgi:hypothetical protein
MSYHWTQRDLDDPLVPWCRSCQLPVFPEQDKEEILFAEGSEHRLEELNGTYHAQCARPFVSGKRALDLLSRGSF